MQRGNNLWLTSRNMLRLSANSRRVRCSSRLVAVSGSSAAKRRDFRRSKSTAQSERTPYLTRLRFDLSLDLRVRLRFAADLSDRSHRKSTRSHTPEMPSKGRSVRDIWFLLPKSSDYA